MAMMGPGSVVAASDIQERSRRQIPSESLRGWRLPKIVDLELLQRLNDQNFVDDRAAQKGTSAALSAVQETHVRLPFP